MEHDSKLFPPGILINIFINSNNISFVSTGDLEKEKERLQNILATGKDKVEKKTQKKPIKVEETVPEVDRFDECK